MDPENPQVITGPLQATAIVPSTGGYTTPPKEGSSVEEPPDVKAAKLHAAIQERLRAARATQKAKEAADREKSEAERQRANEKKREEKKEQTKKIIQSVARRLARLFMGKPVEAAGALTPKQKVSLLKTFGTVQESFKLEDCKDVNMDYINLMTQATPELDNIPPEDLIMHQNVLLGMTELNTFTTSPVYSADEKTAQAKASRVLTMLKNTIVFADLVERVGLEHLTSIFEAPTKTQIDTMEAMYEGAPPTADGAAPSAPKITLGEARAEVADANKQKKEEALAKKAKKAAKAAKAAKKAEKSSSDSSDEEAKAKRADSSSDDDTEPKPMGKKPGGPYVPDSAEKK